MVSDEVVKRDMLVRGWGLSWWDYSFLYIIVSLLFGLEVRLHVLYLLCIALRNKHRCGLECIDPVSWDQMESRNSTVGNSATIWQQR
jgi:hypothetical protein